MNVGRDVVEYVDEGSAVEKDGDMDVDVDVDVDVEVAKVDEV